MSFLQIVRLPIALALLLCTQVGRAAIVSFTASPATFLPGQEVTLAWSVTAGDAISINQGVGAVSGTSAPANVSPVAIAALTHRWSFSEASGTAVNDSSGTAHGVIRGTPFTRPAGQVSMTGGSSATAAYIDLPNGLISPLSEVTLEGWMTVNGAQSWSRVFDFGRTNQTSPGAATGELTGPGSVSGNTTGTDYLTLSAQVSVSQATKRLSMRDNNVEQSIDVADATTNGAQFHFAVVYLATPGAQNSVFTATPPPVVDNVSHSPKAPKPWETVTVTARVSDAQGVGSVQLKYQTNAPGAYIPSTMPLSVAQLLANPLQNLPANSAFESTGWTTVPMVDDGSVAGDTPGDGIFTARIPAQPHRTLVRYRIVAADLGGASVTVPTADDPRKISHSSCTTASRFTPRARRSSRRPR